MILILFSSTEYRESWAAFSYLFLSWSSSDPLLILLFVFISSFSSAFVPLCLCLFIFLLSSSAFFDLKLFLTLCFSSLFSISSSSLLFSQSSLLFFFSSLSSFWFSISASSLFLSPLSPPFRSLTYLASLFHPLCSPPPAVPSSAPPPSSLASRSDWYTCHRQLSLAQCSTPIANLRGNRNGSLKYATPFSLSVFTAMRLNVHPFVGHRNGELKATRLSEWKYERRLIGKLLLLGVWNRLSGIYVQ